MALKPMTIRFAPDALGVIHEAAGELGISTAQFVREAALMRAMLVGASRTMPTRKLAVEVERLSRDKA